jgi:HlyD family secretion protein
MTGGRLLPALAAVFALAACTEESPQAFQGWVEADLIFVSPDESGRVETLAVREGDHVEKDAPLFAVDADLQQADVMQNKAALTNAKQDLERAKALLSTNAGKQKNVEDAEAALRTAQARLNAAQTRLARRKVPSPVSGIVQQIYFRPGEMVAAGRPVVSLLPPANIKIRFYVPEYRLPDIKLGDSVRVTCDNCPAGITARVSFIAQQAEFTPPVIYSREERAKLVFLVEARTDKSDSLRVGQPVSITLADQGPQP